MIDTMLIRKYLDLVDKIVGHTELLKNMKQQKKNMAAKIHSMLAAEGIGKVNVFGTTVFPVRKMRASSRGMPALIEAFKAEGLDAMVKETVNASTLTGFVNEFDPDRMCSADELREKLPLMLRDHINLFEDMTLGVRKSE